ncbi:unnamed protein product [Boreogadus saida]
METEMEKGSDGEGEMEGVRGRGGEGEMERQSGGDGAMEGGGVCSPGCEPASALEPLPGRPPSEWSRAGPASLPPLGCMGAAPPVPGLLCRLSSS